MDIYARYFFVGDCCVSRRKFSSICGLYPPEASNIFPSAAVTMKNVSRALWNVPGDKLPQAEMIPEADLSEHKQVSEEGGAGEGS